MNISFKIAYRFLINNKKQTALIALSIAIGISIQIFLGLLIQNLQNGLIENTIGSSSHITIKDSDSNVIDKGNVLKDKVQSSDKRINIAIETLEQPAFISSNDKNLNGLIRGFDINEANKIYDFKQKLIKGHLPKEYNDIVIGKDIAKELGVSVQEDIKILTPNKKEVDAKVVGILDFKVEALNKSFVISNIDTVRSIYGLSDNSITSIEIQVPNEHIFEVQEISNNINSNISNSYKVSNWIEANETLLSGLKGQSASSYTIQLAILLSVVVAISSILAITVIQKTKQIGILKAMGITDKKASLIFIIQGGLLGIIGSLLGSFLGIIMFKSFTVFVKNSDGSPLISGNINIEFIFISVIVAIIACIISSIIPSKKSLKLNPVDAIKL